jgi:flavoprotein
MDISQIDVKALEFTQEELDALADILVKAKEIQEDHTLMRLVSKHAERKVTEFKSVEDLKNHSKNLQKTTNEHPPETDKSAKIEKPKDNKGE